MQGFSIPNAACVCAYLNASRDAARTRARVASAARRVLAVLPVAALCVVTLAAAGVVMFALYAGMGGAG